jgi:hypothetical protein
MLAIFRVSVMKGDTRTPMKKQVKHGTPKSTIADWHWDHVSLRSALQQTASRLFNAPNQSPLPLFMNVKRNYICTKTDERYDAKVVASLAPRQTFPAHTSKARRYERPPSPLFYNSCPATIIYMSLISFFATARFCISGSISALSVSTCFIRHMDLRTCRI